MSVAVHKTDGESAAGCARCCLYSPGPHEREEGCGACVADESGSVHGAVGWVDDQHGIAGDNDREDSEWVYWSGEFGIVGEESCDVYDCDREERDR